MRVTKTGLLKNLREGIERKMAEHMAMPQRIFWMKVDDLESGPVEVKMRVVPQPNLPGGPDVLPEFTILAIKKGGQELSVDQLTDMENLRRMAMGEDPVSMDDMVGHIERTARDQVL